MLGIDFNDPSTFPSSVPNRMFLLNCPGCGKSMRYKENLNTPQKNSDISIKKKRCVFCGKTFSVKSNIIRSIG